MIPQFNGIVNFLFRFRSPARYHLISRTPDKSDFISLQFMQYIHLVFWHILNSKFGKLSISNNKIKKTERTLILPVFIFSKACGVRNCIQGTQSITKTN
jgi:hypothetical protein